MGEEGGYFRGSHLSFCSSRFFSKWSWFPSVLSVALSYSWMWVSKHICNICDPASDKIRMAHTLLQPSPIVALTKHLLHSFTAFYRNISRQCDQAGCWLQHHINSRSHGWSIFCFFGMSSFCYMNDSGPSSIPLQLCQKGAEHCISSWGWDGTWGHTGAEA